MNKQLQIHDTLLPMCASCKKIRDDNGIWHMVEEIICMSLDSNFTHTICPACASLLYPNLVEHIFAETHPLLHERSCGHHHEYL